MTFGKKLLWQRRKNNMSQEALAAELEVSRQAISKWEQDGALPDASNIVRIARLFGVSTDYLLLDEIDEEGKLPSTPETAPEPHKPSDRLSAILSTVSAAAGLLGHFIIYVLSRFIEVPYLRKTRMADGTTVYEGGGNITTRSYSAFVTEYRLDALCALFTLLILAGAAFLLWRSRARIKDLAARLRARFARSAP